MAPMDVNRCICCKATLHCQQTGLSIVPTYVQQQECSNHFPLNDCNTAHPNKIALAISPLAEMTGPTERTEAWNMVGI